MKLITEISEEVEFITEAKDDGTKRLYIRGPFLQSEVKNRNGRMYPKGTMIKEGVRYTNAYIKEDRAYGELGHPQGPIVNLDRASHRITELKEDGNNFIGSALIMDTPNGKIVKSILESGGKLGVSSRGMGSLVMKNGINEVQDDFRLATAADIVADPSAPDAFVQGIMEGVDWLFVGGEWVPQYVDEAQQTIKKASRADLEEVKIRVFQDFLSKL